MHTDLTLCYDIRSLQFITVDIILMVCALYPCLLLKCFILIFISIFIFILKHSNIAFYDKTNTLQSASLFFLSFALLIVDTVLCRFVWRASTLSRRHEVRSNSNHDSYNNDDDDDDDDDDDSNYATMQLLL